MKKLESLSKEPGARHRMLLSDNYHWHWSMDSGAHHIGTKQYFTTYFGGYYGCQGKHLINQPSFAGRNDGKIHMNAKGRHTHRSHKASAENEYMWGAFLIDLPVHKPQTAKKSITLGHSYF